MPAARRTRERPVLHIATERAGQSARRKTWLVRRGSQVARWPGPDEPGGSVPAPGPQAGAGPFDAALVKDQIELTEP
jgi:hypothetical protein